MSRRPRPLDVAIVGMACRFPGAGDLAAYWENVLAARSAIREVPPSRWDADLFHDPDSISRELLWENLLPALNSPGYLDAFTNLAGYDIRHRLEEIADPTLIVWGRNDRVVPVPAALSYERRIPDSRLEIFDETGHVPQLERPVRFNRSLERFLAEPRGVSGR